MASFFHNEKCCKRFERRWISCLGGRRVLSIFESFGVDTRLCGCHTRRTTTTLGFVVGTCRSTSTAYSPIPIMHSSPIAIDAPNDVVSRRSFGDDKRQQRRRGQCSKVEVSRQGRRNSPSLETTTVAMEKGGRIGIGTGGNDKSPTTRALPRREMISVAEI
jgi:hypothetical protein